MRTTLLAQIAKRRVELKISTSEMPLLAGINRQQYEKIEKGGNPNLATLDKIAEAIDAEILLIPKEKLREIKRLLDPDSYSPIKASPRPNFEDLKDDYIPDPWLMIEGKEPGKP